MGLEEIQDCNEEYGLCVAYPIPFSLLLIGLLLILIGDIDDKKTESVRVQTKSSGWWIIGREKEEVSEEPAEMKQAEKKKPQPMRRATVDPMTAMTDKSKPEKKKTEPEPEKSEKSEKPAPKRRATTWLTRSPSKDSLTSVTPPENSKEDVKAETTSSSSFWKLSLPSSSNSTAPPPATTATTTSTSTAVVPVSEAPQGEGVYPHTPSHTFTLLIDAIPYHNRQSPHKLQSGSSTPVTPSTSSQPSTPK
jgi:hypothetical protein